MDISDPYTTTTQRFSGAEGDIVADVCGPAEGQPVLFLHGGGQTRASWGAGMGALAALGFRAMSMDLRGHGESGWAPSGDYSLDGFLADLHEIARQIGRPPVLIGASLGGLTSLLFAGEGGPSAARALVLVDVVPQLEPKGAEKIGGFMRANPQGFASVEEAADAVSAYLPHRPRPKDVSGLQKNLRLENGRYYWHWDPKLMEGPNGPNPGLYLDRLEDAARNLKVPTLLVRGRLSDVVSLDGVRKFLALTPHAEFVDVADADHMVAGDRNDAFNNAIVDFLQRVAAD